MDFDNEIKTLIENQGAAFEGFKAKHDERIEEIERKLGRIEAGAIMGGSGGQEQPAGGMSAEAKAEFGGFIRKGIEGKSMSVGSDPDGGVLVGSVIAPAIYRAVVAVSPLRSLAGVVRMTTGDAYETPTDAGAAIEANWVGEVDSRPVTASPKINSLRIPVAEIYAMPELSQKLLDDNNFNAEGFVVAKIADSFSAKANVAYVNGDGVAKPRGFATYPTAATADATRSWGTIQHVATGTSGGFTTSGGANGAEVFVDAIAALKPAYRANAAWTMNRTTFAAVSKLKDTTGRFLLETNVARGTPPSLLGYPVETVEEMPDIGANSLSIAFGDWQRAYLIADRIDIRMLRDPFTAKGFVRFYTTMRTGGALLDSTALKFIKFAAS